MCKFKRGNPDGNGGKGKTTEHPLQKISLLQRMESYNN